MDLMLMGLWLVYDASSATWSRGSVNATIDTGSVPIVMERMRIIVKNILRLILLIVDHLNCSMTPGSSMVYSKWHYNIVDSILYCLGY